MVILVTSCVAVLLQCYLTQCLTIHKRYCFLYIEYCAATKRQTCSVCCALMLSCEIVAVHSLACCCNINTDKLLRVNGVWLLVKLC